MATRFVADSLLDELDAMGEELARMSGVRPATMPLRGFVPPVDVWETETELVIEIDAPGCRAENISAEFVDGQLVVTGERASSQEASRRYRSERWQGRFVRTFQVADANAADKISASYHDGVLTLRVAKPEQQRPKRIDIEHGSQTKAIDTTAESRAVGSGT